MGHIITIIPKSELIKGHVKNWTASKSNGKALALALAAAFLLWRFIEVDFFFYDPLGEMQAFKPAEALGKCLLERRMLLCILYGSSWHILNGHNYHFDFKRPFLFFGTVANDIISKMMNAYLAHAH